jgi:hypothetical protein
MCHLIRGFRVKRQGHVEGTAHLGCADAETATLPGDSRSGLACAPHHPHHRSAAKRLVEPLAPTQYAAFVLREASYIPVSLDHDGGCGYGEIRAWLRLQQHPQGRIWLDRILKAGPTPAGRVLAEAGLGRLGGSLANSERRLVLDSVRILSDSGWGWWTPAQVREQLAGARLGKHLASAGPCQQWGLN